MDYYGTDGDDNIDQTKLTLNDWPRIYGGAGNDTITVTRAEVVGGEGNDTIIGTPNSFSSLMYFSSIKGVIVDISSGTAQDGFGTIDKFSNINSIHGTRFDDKFIGGKDNDEFWGDGGNDTFVGGGGSDQVNYWETSKSEVQITYDESTDTFTIKKNTQKGDTGTDILTGFNNIKFYVTQYDVTTVSKYDFIPNPSKTSTSDDVKPSQYKSSDLITTITDYKTKNLGQVYTVDLNNDGHDDLVGVGASYPFDGTPIPQPGFVAFNDGTDHFILANDSQFPVKNLKNVHPREIIFDDFNNDGIKDIFIACHGYDALPFPGEQNLLFLSNPDGTWIDATKNIPVNSDFTHSTSSGDVNGDGYDDIVVGNNPLNWLDSIPYILINNGKGGFTKNTTSLPINHTGYFDNNSKILSNLLADLDDDGKDDLILGLGWSTDDTPRPNRILWNNNGNYLGQSTLLPMPAFLKNNYSTYDIQPIDINQDGLQDLVIAYQFDVNIGGWELQILENQGNHVFQDKTAYYLPESASHGLMPTKDNPESQTWIQFIKIIDVNNDGRMDFAVDARGITNIPEDFPLLFIDQPEGKFKPITVSGIDSKSPWLFDFTTEFGKFGKGGGFTNINFWQGSATINIIPIDTGPIANHTATGNLNIVGNPIEGETLKISSTLDDVDGLVSISYQWLRNGLQINKAIGNEYTLNESDVGKFITVKATYKDAFNVVENKISSPTLKISNINHVPKGLVTIVGSAVQNQILKIKNTLEDADGLGSIKYQWLRDGENISNASQSSYTLTSIDVGKKISVKAYYTDLLGTTESVNSSEVVPTVTLNHAPTGTALIKGLATWGTTLAITHTIKDSDGLGKLSYTWQNDSGKLSTNTTYTLADTDIGKKVWAIISYTDKKDNFEEVRSNIVDVTVSNQSSAVNDMLIGTDKADKLNGLAGDDTLIGGLGKDTLTGGVGADIFKFTSVDDSPVLPKKTDIISDFKHAQGDKIDLSEIDINPTLEGKQSFIPINAQTFSANATGQLRFDTKTSTLYGSTNSDPAPEFAIVLSGVKSLTVDDFIL